MVGVASQRFRENCWWFQRGEKNTFGFVWIFEPKLQGKFAPNLCGANLKQEQGALVNDFVKACQSWGTDAAFMAFCNPSVRGPWWIFLGWWWKWLLKAPIFGPSKKTWRILGVEGWQICTAIFFHTPFWRQDFIKMRARDVNRGFLVFAMDGFCWRFCYKEATTSLN